MEEKEIKEQLWFYKILTMSGLSLMALGLLGLLIDGRTDMLSVIVGGLAIANTGLIGLLGLAINTIYKILRGEDNDSK